tara:strand:+ start:168 stop:467 length:300 start_codon:yes stop_codon:yes gene_type:complete
MQYDIKSTKPLTATGAFVDQNNSNLTRYRIKGLYAVCGASAGSVAITDGASGETLFTLNTPTAANAGYVFILLPGEGILSALGAYGTVTNTTSTVLFYG